MRSAPSTSTEAKIMPEAPLAVPISGGTGFARASVGNDPSTHRWSTSKRLGPTEDELRRADGDAVLVVQLRPLLAAAVDRQAVRRFEIEDPVRGALLAELCVPSRDVG